MDAIVHSTNETFMDRGNLSTRIVNLAGKELKAELSQMEACRTGEAKITPGYNLPARFIFHTVGPRYNAKYENAAESALHGCYKSCLQAMKENKIRTLGLCIINSVSRGYPQEHGAHVALRTVRKCLEIFHEDIDALIFAIDNDYEFDIYHRLMPLYFPRSQPELQLSAKKLEEDLGNEWGEKIIEDRVIRISTFGSEETVAGLKLIPQLEISQPQNFF